jgi:ribonuclease BN (tRNA processing enzyme)
VEPGPPAEILGLRWQAAANVHSQRSLALRLEADGRSLFYSGDGRPTPETVALASGCDLAVHEAFHLQGESKGHGSVARCLDFAREAGVRRLALVHMAWTERRRERELAQLLAEAENGSVFVPEAGEEIRL